MNILVTGGAGFIGSHIVDRLVEEGHSVWVVDNLVSGFEKNINSQANFICGDILDIAKLGLPEQMDYVFHLAAQIFLRKSVLDPAYDAEVNVMGTLRVLDYAIKSKVKRVVYASSAAVYGTCETIPTNEDEPLKCISPYSLSKRVGEDYLALYGNLYSLPYTILRGSNVYGPRQGGEGKDSGVIAIFIKNASEGKELVVYGDGNQTRDFTYVDDIVKAYLLCMKQTENNVFNIGRGEETSLNSVIESLRVRLPDLKIKYVPVKQGDVYRSWFDISKARTLLGYDPQVSIQEGIKRVLDFSE